MWEGILGKWADEVPGWVSCPASAAPQPANIWQQVMSTFNHWTGVGGVADDTDDGVLCPYHWAEPIHQLNCDIVWPKELDEPPYKHISHLRGYGNHEHLGYDAGIDVTNEDASQVYLELDTPEYAGVISERLIVEKLLAQAGVRLAAVINWLFADIEEGSESISRRNTKLTVLEI